MSAGVSLSDFLPGVKRNDFSDRCAAWIDCRFETSEVRAGNGAKKKGCKEL